MGFTVRGGGHRRNGIQRALSPPTPSSPPTDIGGEVGLLLPLQPDLLGHGHCPPGRRLPGPHSQVPHPGCQASCLCPNKGCAERAPVLAQHLSHPVVSDGPPSLPGQVQDPGLRYGPDIILSRSVEIYTTHLTQHIIAHHILPTTRFTPTHFTRHM